jgi:hypothetical protein
MFTKTDNDSEVGGIFGPRLATAEVERVQASLLKGFAATLGDKKVRGLPFEALPRWG